MRVQGREQTLKVLFSEFVGLSVALGPGALELWRDAIALWTLAGGKRVAVSRRARLLKAAALLAFAAFEAWTNLFAAILEESGRSADGEIPRDQIDFLLERKRKVKNGSVVFRPEHHPPKNRYKMLYTVVGGCQPSLTVWQHLEESFELRESLVHPKSGHVRAPFDANRMERAIQGLLAAEIALAKAWDVAENKGRKGVSTALVVH